MLSNALSEFGGKDALCIGGVAYSYEMLDCWSRRIAAMLTGPTIAILPGRSFETFASVVAAARSGHTYVPLNPDLPDDLILNQLTLAEPSSLFVDHKMFEKAKRLLKRVDRSLSIVLLDRPERENAWREFHPHQIKWVDDGHVPPVDEIDRVVDAPLYQLFTSGTTGIPKRIAIPRSNVSAYLEAIASNFDFCSNDRFSHFFKLSFDLSVHDLFVAWTNGGCLCVPSPAELLDPVAFARKNKLSVWFSVPSVASLAILARKLQPESLPTIRHALFCGEALSWEILEAFSEAAPSAAITNLYGPTEATIAITHHRVTADDKLRAYATNGAVPIGKPFENQEVLVVDSDLNPIKDERIGELLLGGSQLAPGYQGDLIQTASHFLDLTFEGYASNRWYRTGDLVRQSDGRLFFVGRNDSQIKWRGFRIELGEIEAALGEVAKTPLAVVVPWPPPSEGGIKKLLAFLGEPHAPVKEVRQMLRDRLPSHMLPAEFITIDSASDFRNANEKIDRQKIVEYHRRSLRESAHE